MSTNKTANGGVTSRSHEFDKNIACLESLWYEDPERPLTVAPLLDVIEKSYHRVHVINLTCNTKGELKFCLDKLPRNKYRILYLAFHGERGAIALGDGSTVPLPELSVLMGTKFKDGIVIFGSCDTMNASKRQLQQFLEATQTSLLIGYGGSINWVDSAAMELIVLDWLENFKSLGAFQNRLRNDYAGLMKLTGLKIERRTG